MRNSRLKYLLILGIVLTLIAGIGSTYSFFIYRQEGSNVSLESGEISINYSDNVNYISVPDAYPVSDEVGKIYPYYSDFTINSVTDKHPIKYEIQIIPNSNNTIDTKYVKVYLTDQDDNPITQPMFYDDLKQATYNTTGKIVDTGFFTTSDTQDFRLRVWIDESYDKNLIETFGFNIYLYATNSGINDARTLYERAELTLANKLTDYDIDGTRYVRGATIDNNYVWYSGKMWRIVALNNDGTVKLVTQDNMTSIAWSTDSTNTNYTTSQIRSWLNTELLPTINEDLIVESNWDYTTYSSFPTEKDTANAISVSNKVGLLGVYDYMMTGGTSDSTTSTTFLNNGYLWWTISPQASDSGIWIVFHTGYADYYSQNYGYGVRPSVNLKSDITLTGDGTGELETPYMLEGDTEVGQTNELLSSRLSGEYIKFNNVRYRIVGVENGLTKITMADYSVNQNTLSSVSFGTSADELTFSTTYGIGKYLDDWYNATSENDTDVTYTGLYLSTKAKTMIATSTDGVRWYAGTDNNTELASSYIKAKEGTAIEATIGLPRYGEMFSTQFSKGYGSSTNTWLMTKYYDSNIWVASKAGDANPYIFTTNIIGVRPSFYLKSDVKITGGSGMPHDPYTISQ